jgi:hypothetical protein
MLFESDVSRAPVVFAIGHAIKDHVNEDAKEYLEKVSGLTV